MTHVVCEPCVGCRYTDCVAVCPVDCFREGEQMLTIEPEICTDCELCVPECPVEAIYRDIDVPEKWAEWIEINAHQSVVTPVIVERQDALPGAPPRPGN